MLTIKKIQKLFESGHYYPSYEYLKYNKHVDKKTLDEMLDKRSKFSGASKFKINDVDIFFIKNNLIKDKTKAVKKLIIKYKDELNHNEINKERELTSIKNLCLLFNDLNLNFDLQSYYQLSDFFEKTELTESNFINFVYDVLRLDVDKSKLLLIFSQKNKLAKVDNILNIIVNFTTIIKGNILEKNSTLVLLFLIKWFCMRTNKYFLFSFLISTIDISNLKKAIKNTTTSKNDITYIILQVLDLVIKNIKVIVLHHRKTSKVKLTNNQSVTYMYCLDMYFNKKIKFDANDYIYYINVTKSANAIIKILNILLNKNLLSTKMTKYKKFRLK